MKIAWTRLYRGSKASRSLFISLSRFALLFFGLVLPGYLIVKVNLSANRRIDVGETPAENHPINVDDPGWHLHPLTAINSADDGSCHSMKERQYYYPNSIALPFPSLILALRKYELMHRKCVKEVSDWSTAFDKGKNETDNCRYLVWLDMNAGLGNRLLSYMAAFEYALVTNRAMLADSSRGLDRLFCNPIHGSSIWIGESSIWKHLRKVVRLEQFWEAEKGSHAKDRILENHTRVHVFLNFDAKPDAQQFFCEKVQRKLSQVPWIVLQTGEYIGTGYLLSESFERKLRLLFPDGNMTTWMARYLLLPHNDVWDRVRSVYSAYVPSKSNFIGVQIREKIPYHPGLVQRVIECLEVNSFVPRPLSVGDLADRTSELANGRAVPVTRGTVMVFSLYHQHYDEFKAHFTDNVFANNSVIAVHHENNEGSELHDLEATLNVAKEILLLSMTHITLTSWHSTFGYVARALRGPRSGGYMMRIRSIEWKDDGFCWEYGHSNACYHAFPQDLNCSLTNSSAAGSGSPFRHSYCFGHGGQVLTVG